MSSATCGCPESTEFARNRPYSGQTRWPSRCGLESAHGGRARPAYRPDFDTWSKFDRARPAFARTLRNLARNWTNSGEAWLGIDQVWPECLPDWVHPGRRNDTYLGRSLSIVAQVSACPSHSASPHAQRQTVGRRVGFNLFSCSCALHPSDDAADTGPTSLSRPVLGTDGKWTASSFAVGWVTSC